MVDKLIKLYMELVGLTLYWCALGRRHCSLPLQIVLFTDYTLWKFTEKAGTVSYLRACVEERPLFASFVVSGVIMSNLPSSVHVYPVSVVSVRSSCVSGVSVLSLC